MDSEWWKERLDSINADIKRIDAELDTIHHRVTELQARRNILKEAARTSRNKLASYTKVTQQADREVVRRDDVAKYLNRYLDEIADYGGKLPNGTLTTLADKAGVSLAVIEKIRYGKGGAWITFGTADKVLTAIGLGHLLGTAIEVKPRYSP